MTCKCGIGLGIGAKDGARKRCSCGREYEYTYDELYGHYWVRRVKLELDMTRQKKRIQAQRRYQ